MANEYAFYEAASAGYVFDADIVLKELKSYKNLIIWGAGNLGVVLGRELIQRGIEVKKYWDARYRDISSCNGVTVEKPLTRFGDGSMLVVFCITNAFVIPKLYKQMEEAGIAYIEGVHIYQVLLCPSSIEHFDVSECYKRKECNVATCKRQSNIAYALYGNGEKVFINTLDVYLTQACSLSCKYCYIYENSYQKEKKKNFPTKRILKDVDLICDAASFIKRLVPFGGEPFLHPDIADIIGHMAEKKNVGTIDVISNGIFNQPDEVLTKLKYDHVKINVSNYNKALPAKLIEIREDNIRRMQELRLNVIVHNDTPQWRKPGLLNKNNFSAEELCKRKGKCANFVNIGENEKDTTETMIVKNGMFFACQHCDTMYNLGVIENTGDALVLDGELTGIALAREIKKLINKSYYQACDYCHPSIDLVETAGEQGVDEAYLLSVEQTDC